MISGDFAHKIVQSMMKHLCEILYFSKAQCQDIFAALNRTTSGKQLFPAREVVPEPQPLLESTIGR